MSSNPQPTYQYPSGLQSSLSSLPAQQTTLYTATGTIYTKAPDPAFPTSPQTPYTGSLPIAIPIPRVPFPTSFPSTMFPANNYTPSHNYMQYADLPQYLRPILPYQLSQTPGAVSAIYYPTTATPVVTTQVVLMTGFAYPDDTGELPSWNGYSYDSGSDNGNLRGERSDDDDDAEGKQDDAKEGDEVSRRYSERHDYGGEDEDEDADEERGRGRDRGRDQDSRSSLSYARRRRQRDHRGDERGAEECNEVRVPQRMAGQRDRGGTRGAAERCVVCRRERSGSSLPHCGILRCLAELRSWLNTPSQDFHEGDTSIL